MPTVKINEPTIQIISKLDNFDLCNIKIIEQNIIDAAVNWYFCVEIKNNNKGQLITDKIKYFLFLEFLICL